MKLNPNFESLDDPQVLIDHLSKVKEEPSDALKELEKYRVDPSKELKPPEIALKYHNPNSDSDAIIGTLGNFSMVIGKAKSRKSFFVGMAVAAATRSGDTLNNFIGALPRGKRKVLYFDTEQGEYHAQLALRRICTQIGIDSPENLLVYQLRSCRPSERMNLIEAKIYATEELGFVLIDGIKDLVTSINDEEQATEMSSKLLKWTEELGIHLMTVLHQNKSDNNARGHLGTELINKAETVLSITKSDEDKNISVVEPQQCRNKEPDSFGFEIIDNLPMIAESFESRTAPKSKKPDPLDLEDYKKYQLLTEVFSKEDSHKYGNLVSQLKLACNKQESLKVGDNKIKDLITYMKNEGWLSQSVNKGPYTLEPYQEIV